MSKIKIAYDCGDYFIDIDCLEIHAYHDRRNHRWIFLDSTTGREFFNISEKKGEIIIDFVKAVTNLKCEDSLVSQGEDYLADKKVIE